MMSALLPPGARLNKRQRDVLYFICKGLHNSEVAQQLGIGERTVKGYVSQLLLIFGATNRTEMVGMLALDGMQGFPEPREKAATDINSKIDRRFKSVMANRS